MTLAQIIVLSTEPSAEGACGEISAGAARDGEIARLTTGLAAGDEDSYRAFHAAYFDRLLRYLYVVARGDEQAARDAVQETFVRAARRARRFDNEAKFWSWLTVLARSAATDGARRRRSYWAMLARYASGWFSSHWPASADDSCVGADERLHRLLGEAMDRLPEDDRALIEGKYIHGDAMKDLAAQCQTTERAIESRLGRLRKRLRDQVFEKLRGNE